MKIGWTGYFNLFPDYKIELLEIFERNDTVTAFGFASGRFKNSTDPKNYWRLPAAWKARVMGSRVKLWQVFADTKITFEIIDRNK
jgi:hypothetical protein